VLAWNVLKVIGVDVEALEDERTTHISLEIDPDDFNLEEGDLMSVTLVLEQKEDVLWLPPQAIRTFEGRRFVIVQQDGF
jgi:hypothetical protein